MNNKKQIQYTITSCNFAWVNPDIEKNFTAEDARSTDYKVFHFDRYISSEDAVKEIEKEEYAPANISELLAYTKDGWNGTDWVLALGSVAGVDGSRRVPYLGVSDRYIQTSCQTPLRYLYLHLHRWDGDWGGSFRFLAVRNSGTKSSGNALPLGQFYMATDRQLDALTFISQIEERLNQLKKFISPTTNNEEIK